MATARGFFVLSLLFAAPALAAPVELPLRVSLDAVRDAIAAELAARSGEVYRQGPCTYLRLEAPRLEAIGAQLRLAAPGTGALGAELGGQCQTAIAWRGDAEFVLVPVLEGQQLRVRIVDSNVWDPVKGVVHARLEAFRYDLAPLRAQLGTLLRAVAPPQHAAEMGRALESLRLLAPRVEATHVAVPLALEVPDAWLAAPPPAPAAPLSEPELAALEKALEPLDAFLVHSIRTVARESGDPTIRQRLFTLLLETRYALVAILSGEAPPSLRALFFDTWSELRAILADAGLRTAAFVDAGDALVALERAVPGLQAHVGADGLRHLARALGETAGDPLGYGWDDDPELRELFKVDAIPESTSSAGALMRTADDAGRPLDRWVPTREELPEYEQRVAKLLERTGADELARATLDPSYHAAYRHLVPTTALIESCWRQYVVRGGKATYLRSPAGSVGLMQVNQVVWRGFYDVQRLRWDTAYNARAGTQILMRYVKDYAVPYAKKSGKADSIARAAYAVYNAGPRAVGRFDKAKPHPREARVDAKLLKLYRGIASGGEPDLKSCGVRPAASG